MTAARSAESEAWIARARAVPIEEEIARRGILLKKNGAADRCGPCPRCGGVDRFSINTTKQVFNCRGCGAKGDVIALAMYLDNADFDAACETLTGETRPTPNSKNRAAEPRKVVVAQFEYHDRDSAVAYAVERIEYQNTNGSPVLTKDGKPKKSFRQKRPNPDRQGEWIYNVDGVPVALYRLPEVIEAVANEHFVVITEGEAKADLLASWNVPATCCAGGAGKWRPEHSEFLRGADVILLPDNDAPGAKHVESVAASLQGIAASIKILGLPSLPPKGDLIDWQRNGGTVERLHELIEREAKPWTPKAKDEAHEARTPEFSDEALALRFAERHAAALCYVAAWSRWLSFDGKQWSFDSTLLAFDRSRQICREAAASRKGKIAAQLASAKTVAAVERLAKADRRLAATVDQWDTDLFVLNTHAGVVDLHTGKLRSHRAEDYLTKITAVAPDRN
jgi:putative DNA primase/helicase